MYQLIKQGVRFFGVGLITFPVGVGVTALCHEIFRLPEKFAAAIALTVLLVLGFILARRVVFISNGNIGRQAWRFLLVAAMARATEYVLFLCLSILAGLHYLVALVGALGLSFVLKFIIYRSWIFTDSRSPA